MPKSRRRFAILLGIVFIGAVIGWLGWSAINPQWGGTQIETFIVRRARAHEWKRDSNANWQRLTRDNVPG